MRPEVGFVGQREANREGEGVWYFTLFAAPRRVEAEPARVHATHRHARGHAHKTGPAWRGAADDPAGIEGTLALAGQLDGGVEDLEAERVGEGVAEARGFAEDDRSAGLACG